MASGAETATGASEQKDEVMEQPQDDSLALEVATHNNEEERMARVQAEEIGAEGHR